MAEPTASPTGDGTNHVVAAHATKPGALPLGEMALIGIMGKPGEMRALFRGPGGGVATVTEGTPTQLGQILEITDAGVVVTRSSGNAIFIPPIPIG